MEHKTDIKVGYDETLQALNGAWKKNPYMNEAEFKGAVQEHYLGQSVGKSDEFLRGAQIAATVFTDMHRLHVEANEHNQSLAPAVGW